MPLTSGHEPANRQTKTYMLNNCIVRLARDLRPMKTTGGIARTCHPSTWRSKFGRLVGVFCATLAAAGVLLLPNAAPAQSFSLNPGFNKAGDILIADQFNNRVIEATPAGDIVWSFGLGPNDFSAKSI